jgi:predicted ATPase
MTATPGSDRNPYRPGAGIAPTYLAGRDRILRRVDNTLRTAPELPANVKITGLRGVGKTVLLKEIERRASESLGWTTSRVQIEPRHNQEEDLADLIRNLSERAIRQASRSARLRARVGGVVGAARGLAKVTFEEFEFSLSGSSARTADVAEALYLAARAAGENGYHGYLLLLDEAQILRDDKTRNGEHPLSLLIAAVNSLQEQSIPVGLILCGLPTLKANLLKARTYSERMFRGEDVAGLDDTGDALAAFVKPLETTGVSATDELVRRVIREVEGYPYFIQLWGAEMWDAARDAGTNVLTPELLDEVEADIYRRLDNDFYDTRVESLTPAEQDLLMATARCPYPPLKTADIRSHSPKTDANVNVLMGRLAEQGVVYRIQKGIYEYTAPKFDGYLERRAERLGF